MNRETAVREAVGVFPDPATLQAAIDDMERHGFMRHELSVLASETTVVEKRGSAYRRVQSAADDPEAPRTIFVPTEMVSIAKGVVVGAPLFLAATITAGVVIAGGGPLREVVLYAALAGVVGAGIGSMVAVLIAQRRARYLKNQMRSGGLVLWVHLRSPDMEKRAKEIMRKHFARDVHIHDMSAYQ